MGNLVSRVMTQIQNNSGASQPVQQPVQQATPNRVREDLTRNFGDDSGRLHSSRMRELVARVTGQPLPEQQPVQPVAQQPALDPMRNYGDDSGMGFGRMSPAVMNVIQQLMAERQASQQAMAAQPVAQQPMQQQPMPSFQQQQVLPFNFPQRYNYFFGPSPFAQSFQSMQHPYGQQFNGFGPQGLFSQLSPFLSGIRNRIY